MSYLCIYPYSKYFVGTYLLRSCEPNDLMNDSLGLSFNLDNNIFQSFLKKLFQVKQTIFQFATKNLKNRPILFYLDEKSVVLLSSIINSNYLNSFGSRSSTHAESSQLRMQFMRNMSALI